MSPIRVTLSTSVISRASTSSPVIGEADCALPAEGSTVRCERSDVMLALTSVGTSAPSFRTYALRLVWSFNVIHQPPRCVVYYLPCQLGRAHGEVGAELTGIPPVLDGAAGIVGNLP